MGNIYGSAQETLDRVAERFGRVSVPRSSLPSRIRLQSPSNSVVPPCSTALDHRLRKAIRRHGHAHILFQIAFRVPCAPCPTLSLGTIKSNGPSAVKSCLGTVVYNSQMFRGGARLDDAVRHIADAFGIAPAVIRRDAVDLWQQGVLVEPIFSFSSAEERFPVALETAG